LRAHRTSSTLGHGSDLRHRPECPATEWAEDAAIAFGAVGDGLAVVGLFPLLGLARARPCGIRTEHGAAPGIGVIGVGF
jgi:hypothetical protein